MREILKLRQAAVLTPRLAAVLNLILVASIAAVSQTSTPTPPDKRGLGIEAGSANSSPAEQTKAKEAKPELVLQTGYNNLFGATRLVFSPDERLLLSERSVIVIMPLAIFFSTLDVAFWSVAPEPSFSTAYAGHTANALLLFLLGITIFYSVEAMHRDRDLKIEPLLWSQAAPNYALLLSKFLATLVLTVCLILAVGVITLALQILKHNGIIVIPNAIFLAAAALFFSTLLRDRYLAYAVAIGTCSGLFYLYSQGHIGWLYNPLLWQLWKDSDLTGGGSRIPQILAQRIHLLAIALACLSFAKLFSRRPSNRRLLAQGRLTGSGWSVALLSVFLIVAIVAGLFVGTL